MPCDSCTAKEMEVEQTGAVPHGGTKRMREKRMARQRYRQTGVLPLVGALGAGSKALLGTIAGAGIYEFGGGAIDFAVNLGQDTFDVVTEPIPSISDKTGKSEVEIKESIGELRSDLEKSITPDGKIDESKLPDGVEVSESVDVDTSVLDGSGERGVNEGQSPVEFNRIDRLTGPKDDDGGSFSMSTAALAGGVVIAGALVYWFTR